MKGIEIESITISDRFSCKKKKKDGLQNPWNSYTHVYHASKGELICEMF